MLSIQEAIRPPSLIVVGDIGNTEVEQQDENQDRNTNPWVRGRGRKEDFQKGIKGVQTMLRDLQNPLISTSYVSGNAGIRCGAEGFKKKVRHRGG